MIIFLKLDLRVKWLDRRHIVELAKKIVIRCNGGAKWARGGREIYLNQFRKISHNGCRSFSLREVRLVCQTENCDGERADLSVERERGVRAQ